MATPPPPGVAAESLSVFNGFRAVDTRLDNLTAQIPAGGTTGQVLVKLSDADYDYGWIDYNPTTPVTLAPLSLSPNTATVGAPYSGSVTGKTASSVLALSGAGATGLSVVGSVVSGTPTTAGTINLIETLAGATNTPRTSSGVATVSAAAVTLAALTLSPNTATVGLAYSGTVTGKTSGSTLSLTGAGAAGLSVVGSAVTGTPTTEGAVNIVETLAGATNTPRTSSGVMTVGAASAFLPTLATAPNGAYGLNKLVSAYSGPAVRVVRASDSAEQDIGFSGNSLDTAAATTFQGASSLTVKTRYDQSGNANHIQYPGTQPTLWLGSGGPTITNYTASTPGTIPATLVIERANCSVFMTTRTPGLGATCAYWMFGDAANLDMGLTTPRTGGQQALQPMIGGASVSATVANKQANAIANIGAIAYVSSGTKQVVRRDDQVAEYGVAAAKTLNIGGQVGQAFSFAGRLDQRSFVVYPAALADADALAVQAALKTIDGAVAPALKAALFTGDSIVFGTGGINNRTITQALSLTSPNTFILRNNAIAGHQLDQHYTQDLSGYVAPGIENFLVADYGHNDIKDKIDGGMTAIQITDQMKSQVRLFTASLRANGFSKIIWQETLPDVSVGWTSEMETARGIWNTFLNSAPVDANGVLCFNAIDQVATDAAFVLSNAETTAGRGMALTANSSDGVHPNESVVIARAAHVSATINAAPATPLALSYTPVTVGSQGAPYTGATPVAQYGTAPYTYSLASGTLPTGLTLNPSTGVISGTPTTVQTQTGIVLRVTDAALATADSTAFQITIGVAQQVVVESSTDSFSATDVTAASIVLPATINAGDLLVIPVAVDGNATLTWDNTTAGTWTQLFNDVQTANRLQIMYKIADGTEDGKTLAVTISVAQQFVARCFRLSGVQGAISCTATGNRGTATSFDPASITAPWGVANNWFLAIAGTDNTVSITGGPTGYSTPDTRISSASGQAGLSTAYKSASVATDDPSAFTSSTSIGYVLATVVVRPS